MAVGDIIVIGPLKVNTIGPDESGNINIPGISPDGSIALAQTAAKLATPVLIDGTSFDGSSNIQTVPASAVFSSTTGKLKNSVTINGVPFDGTADIIISDTGSGGIAGTGIIYIADDNITSATTYIPYLFNTSGSADTLTISSSSLTFNPAIGQLSTTSFNSTSDRRKKEDIEELNYGIDTLLKLQPKQFKFISSQQKSIGFIAQDMIEIMPEVVSIDDEGYMGINYSIITAMLVKSIQELKKEIEILKGN